VIALDSNTVIFAISGRMPRVRKKLEETLLSNTPVGIPAIVLYDIQFGIGKSARRAENGAAFAAFLTLGFDLWAFDAPDAEDHREHGGVHTRARPENRGLVVSATSATLSLGARLSSAVTR